MADWPSTGGGSGAALCVGDFGRSGVEGDASYHGISADGFSSMRRLPLARAEEGMGETSVHRFSSSTRRLLLSRAGEGTGAFMTSPWVSALNGRSAPPLAGSSMT